MMDVNTASTSTEAVSTDENSTQSGTGTGEAVQEPAKAGDKTDPNLLLEALHEERAKRRALEEKLAEISPVPSENSEEEYVSKAEFSELKQRLTKREVLDEHPELKDTWDSFEEFREKPENKGMRMQTAAKAFLAEKGMLEPKRKGLEKHTGGPRQTVSSDTTVEDIKNLREQDPGKYRDMVKKGQLKF